MRDFAGKIAVVTGGGSGMGRELVRQLSAAGCDVAMCDLSADAMAETRSLALAGAASSDVRVTTHVCDVGDEAAILVFRDQVVEQLQADHVNLLFNNAGISGGGSLFTSSRDDWERCFSICWGGVYHSTRAFLPLLVASDEGHVVNTSSVNGFWASLGPDRPHTAYSAAKFAVKGFTEALLGDLRMTAPHVKASVVMPGHIGTSIAINSPQILGKPAAAELGHEALAEAREQWARFDPAAAELSDEAVRDLLIQQPELFRDNAPTTAAQAATIILDGVRAERWRILVGDDAVKLDEQVRAAPEQAYEPEFMQRLVESGAFGNL